MRVDVNTIGGFRICTGVLALLVGGCGRQENVASVSAAVVSDRAPFRSVQQFDIAIMRTQLSASRTLTCADFPASFRLDSPDVRPAFVAATSIPWSGEPNDATVLPLTVPADTPLLVMVEGLAAFAGGTQVIMRGCAENLSFKAGGSNPLSINARATAGTACANDAQCEKNLICHIDPNLSGGGVGYCAKIACTADSDCPPATACVVGGLANGLCARSCETIDDCSTVPQEHQCESRPGPTGCRRVCVRSTWNPGESCK